MMNEAYANNAQQQIIGQQNVASDDRATTRIRQKAERHLGEITEMTAAVEQLANTLFGHLPTPPGAPTTGGLGQIEPVKPQLDAIDGAQFRIDEALESLRRQLARLATL